MSTLFVGSLRAPAVLLAATLSFISAPAVAETSSPAARIVVYDLLRETPTHAPNGAVLLGEGHTGGASALGGFNSGFSFDPSGALRGHGNEAELVVRLTPSTAYRVRLDLTPRRTRRISLFVGGKLIGRQRLRRGRQQVAFVVPAERVAAGDTYIGLHLRGWSRSRGRLRRRRQIRRKPREEVVRVLFHSIAIEPVQDSSTHRYPFLVRVPADGRLVGRLAGAGAATLKIQVAHEANAKELWTRTPPDRGDLNVDLSSLAGKVVRLVLETSAEVRPELLSVTAPARGAPAAVGQRPRNVIVWIIDTLRADKLRCYNPATRVETPHLDAFASRSVRFEKAISQVSHSKPAAATILTGHYPASHGANTYRDRLPRGIPLLSQLFKKAGYRTAAFASNGYIGGQHGFRRGWDKFRNPLREGRPSKAPYLYPLVQRWLRRNKDKPFFLYVHTVDPHVPYNPPRRVLSKYWKGRYWGKVNPRRSGHQLDAAAAGKIRFNARDRRYLEALYDGEVTVADSYFGKLVDLLRELGLSTNTLIAVTADHGEEFWEHRHPGHGHSLFNELIHVPLIIGPAPLTPAGRVVRSDVEIVDLAPTVLSLAGVEVPAAVQGANLTPLFSADPPVPAAAFSNHQNRIGAAQQGRWKYLVYRGGAESLYDLKVDPHEQKDLSAERPIVLGYLRGLFSRWFRHRSRWRKSASGAVVGPQVRPR